MPHARTSATRGATPTVGAADAAATVTDQADRDATILAPAKPSAPASAEFAVGELAFGRYQIKRELGRGGMGAVYLARDVQLDRDVALKAPSASAAGNPDLVERFLREAKAAATLRHPHLCPVFDAGQAPSETGEGRLYITMAYLPGRSLRESVRGPQPIRATVRLLGRLADAMAHAHDHGVIHRDLKPGNVMLDERGKPAITDFGLARRDADDVQVTQTGATLGTPAYMSPEQIGGRQDLIGPRSDIYALGVILYQLLAGRLPFEGTPSAVMAKAYSEDPRPPGAVRAEEKPDVDPVPPELEAIWRRMVARDPADRFESMHAVRSALAEFLKTGAGPGNGDDGTASGSESAELRIEPTPDFSRLKELETAPKAPIYLPVRRLTRRPRSRIRRALIWRGAAAAGALVLLGVATIVFQTPDGATHTMTVDVPGEVPSVSAGEIATVGTREVATVGAGEIALGNVGEIAPVSSEEIAPVSAGEVASASAGEGPPPPADPAGGSAGPDAGETTSAPPIAEPSSDEGWVELFNGQTLANWRAAPTGEDWVVRGGELIADVTSEAYGWAELFSEHRKLPHDFELFLEWSAESGVVLEIQARGSLDMTRHLNAVILNRDGAVSHVRLETYQSAGKVVRFPLTDSSFLQIHQAASSARRDADGRIWHRAHLRVWGDQAFLRVNGIDFGGGAAPEMPEGERLCIFTNASSRAVAEGEGDPLQIRIRRILFRPLGPDGAPLGPDGAPLGSDGEPLTPSQSAPTP